MLAKGTASSYIADSLASLKLCSTRFLSHASVGRRDTRVKFHGGNSPRAKRFATIRFHLDAAIFKVTIVMTRYYY